ncbi:hypothetical protein SNEBB_009222 [Seison nebaliae]|nr:hypothetical protein SNEBB_009222 [Seison nebaliae]
MVLPKNFSYQYMQEKRQIMESLPLHLEEGAHLYGGFLNPDKLGVCLTNTLLSLLLSSATLMNEVRENISKAKCDLLEYVEQVTNDPLVKQPTRKHFSSGDYLRQSLVDAQEGKLSTSVHGVTGLYMLIKNYEKTRNLKKENKIYSRKLFCPPSISKEDLCTIIIREDRPSGPSYIRWSNLLNDVLDHKNEETENYKYKDDWMFSWRSSIKFLNVQIELSKFANVPFWKHVHLQKNPFELLRQDSFEKFNKIYTNDIKIKPQYFLLHLESTSNPEIHPSTYQSMALKLLHMSTSNNIKKLTKENFDNVLIGIEERSLKWPQFGLNEDIDDFSINSMKNQKYSIRGISVYMMDFTRFPFWKVTLNIKDIEPPKFSDKYPCAFTSYNFILNYIKEVLGNPELIQFVNRNSMVVMSV